MRAATKKQKRPVSAGGLVQTMTFYICIYMYPRAVHLYFCASLYGSVPYCADARNGYTEGSLVMCSPPPPRLPSPQHMPSRAPAALLSIPIPIPPPVAYTHTRPLPFPHATRDIARPHEENKAHGGNTTTRQKTTHRARNEPESLRPRQLFIRSSSNLLYCSQNAGCAKRGEMCRNSPRHKGKRTSLVKRHRAATIRTFPTSTSTSPGQATNRGGLFHPTAAKALINQPSKKKKGAYVEHS